MGTRKLKFKTRTKFLCETFVVKSKNLILKLMKTIYFVFEKDLLKIPNVDIMFIKKYLFIMFRVYPS